MATDGHMEENGRGEYRLNLVISSMFRAALFLERAKAGMSHRAIVEKALSQYLRSSRTEKR